jgi:hypothetical protein
MSGVRPNRQEYKWEHASPIMPCGLADLQPADGLAAAGCHLAARRASQVATDRECAAIGYFTSDFLSRNREVGRRRLDASTLGADGGLKVEKPHDHCGPELIISLRIQPPSGERSIFLLRGRLWRVLAPFARRAWKVCGPGRWRANRHRRRDDHRLRPACDRLINERVRHVNRIQGVRDDTYTRLRESPAFPSYTLRAPSSFHLQEFGSTRRCRQEGT